MTRKTFWSLNTLLLVALLLALASSLGHVAYAFSTVNGGNLFEAYISAIAIDLGLLALAGGVSQRKPQGRATWTLWSGIGFFSLISVYGNWLAGINHIQTMDVGLAGVGQWLVSLRPVLLSGVLPILVIYLAEIVSGNFEQEAQQNVATQREPAMKIEVEQSAMQQNGAKPATKKEAIATSKPKKTQRKKGKVATQGAMLAALQEGGPMTNSALAEAVGVNPSTTQRYGKIMIAEGVIIKTTDGLVIANGQPSSLMGG